MKNSTPKTYHRSTVHCLPRNDDVSYSFRQNLRASVAAVLNLTTSTIYDHDNDYGHQHGLLRENGNKIIY